MHGQGAAAGLDGDRLSDEHARLGEVLRSILDEAVRTRRLDPDALARGREVAERMHRLGTEFWGRTRYEFDGRAFESPSDTADAFEGILRDASGSTLVPVLGETLPGQVPTETLERTAGESESDSPGSLSSRQVPVLGDGRHVPTPARDRLIAPPLRRLAFARVSVVADRACDSCGTDLRARSVAWERRDWRGRRKHLPLVKCEACHSAQPERGYVPSKRTRVLAAITAFGATPSHIANVAGINVRTVNRVLAQLREEGLVERRGRSLHVHARRESRA